MTSFVFKSLMIAGAFLFFGGHLPLTDGRAGALPGFACEADLGTCRVGETEFALGERSDLLSSIVNRSRGMPAADLKESLSDPALVALLDEQVVPDFMVAAAETHIAVLANRFIEGVETGRR